jgi:hypothetical protein
MILPHPWTATPEQMREVLAELLKSPPLRASIVGGGLAEDGYAAEWAESVLLPRAYCQTLINMLTLAAPPDVPIEAPATGP